MRRPEHSSAYEVFIGREELKSSEQDGRCGAKANVSDGGGYSAVSSVPGEHSFTVGKSIILQQSHSENSPIKVMQVSSQELHGCVDFWGPLQ